MSDGSQQHRREYAPGDDWFRAALSESSDIALVLKPDTTIVWCNDAVSHLGYDPVSLLGRSLAEIVHPDDLVRAGEVILLEAAGVFKERTPITPALYRVRRSDGTWHTTEVNASTANDDEHLLVIARTGGDLVIYLQLLEAVTSGKPFEQQVASVVELATWRHPSEGYAVCYFDETGERRWHTDGVPSSMLDLDPTLEELPWTVPLGPDPEVMTTGPRLRAAADEAGFIECLVSHVDDPAHPEGARLMIWTTRAGPTVSGHRYAMANMRRALTLVLQQRAQLSMLERAARTDPLTGLASRARLLELIDDADRHRDGDGGGVSWSVLYIDLDGFKAVNDSLGHTRGDLVLRAAAQHLAAVVPDDAVLARMGGDEFVVLCAPNTSHDQATALAQRIVDTFTSPISLGDGVEGENGDDGLSEEQTIASIGTSVGVAVGSAGQAVSSVLDRADQALYRAKAMGRGRWAVDDETAALAPR